jgi:hypothetical protein
MLHIVEVLGKVQNNTDIKVFAQDPSYDQSSRDLFYKYEPWNKIQIVDDPEGFCIIIDNHTIVLTFSMHFLAHEIAISITG